MICSAVSASSAASRTFASPARNRSPSPARRSRSAWRSFRARASSAWVCSNAAWTSRTSSCAASSVDLRADRGGRYRDVALKIADDG